MAYNLNYLRMFMDWWFNDSAKPTDLPPINPYGIHTYLSKYKYCNMYYRVYNNESDGIPQVMILGYTPNKPIMTDTQKFKLLMLRFKIRCQDEIELDFSDIENLTNRSVIYNHYDKPCAFIQLWKLKDTAYTAENIENILRFLETQIDFKSYKLFIECENSSLEYRLFTDIGFDIHEEIDNPKMPLLPIYILKYDRCDNRAKHHDNHIMTTGGYEYGSV